MINLLPQKEKQELLFLKNRNLVIVLGSVALIFLVCLSLVLLSLKFYILQEVNYEKIILSETEKKYQTDSFSSLLDSVKRYNRAIGRSDDFYEKQVYFSSAILQILLIQRPSGIIFNDVILEKADKSSGIKATIYGLSPKRDDLLFFREYIAKQDGVTNVQIPPDHLVKSKNINITINFEIQPIQIQ